MAIADLPVPESGAVAALPVPNTGAPVDGSEVASPMQKGFRSGMNTLGANLNALVGQTGAALGLTEFAADRFKDAENYTKAADTDGVKDWGEVKDFTSLTHFVGRLVGQGAATMAPAVGISVGLRKPIAGSVIGFGAPGAGQQVQNLRQDPVALAKGDKAILGNAAVAGLAEGALFAGAGAPASMMRRAAGTAAKTSLKGAVATDALSNATVMPAADLAGQVAHQQLNPDKKIDTSHLAEEAIIGGTLGAAGGAIGHAVGAAPRLAQSAGELSERFKRKGPPADVETDLPPASVEDASIPEWLKANEEAAVGKAKEWWGKMKDSGLWASAEEFIKDPSVLKEAAADLKAKHYDEKVKPVVDGITEYAKDLGERIKARQETKYSKMDGKADLDSIQQDILNGNPVRLHTPNKEAADLLIKHGYGERQPGYWEPVTKHSEMRGKTDTLVLQTVAKMLPDEFKSQVPADKVQEIADLFAKLARNPEEFTETGVPRTLEKLMGRDAFRDTMKDVAKVVGADHSEVAKAFKAKAKADGSQLDQIKEIINKHARTEYRMDPAKHKVLMDEVAPRLLDKLNDHAGSKGLGNESKVEMENKLRSDSDPEFHQDIYEAFGDKSDAVYKALEKVKPDEITSHDAFEGAEGKEMRDEKGELIHGEDAPRQESPVADKRLNQTFPDTPEGSAKSRALIAELEAEHGRKNVRVRAYLEGKEGEERIAHTMEPAETSGLTPEMFRAVREDPKQNRSKLSEGVISVITEKQPGGVKINLHKLTAEMMRSEPPAGRPGTELDYVRDMFSRGMSALMNTGEIRGFTKSGKEQLIRKTAVGTWDFPDNTPIIKMHGHQYTYGEIKTHKISRKELRGITDEDIKAQEKYIRKSDEFKKNPISDGAVHLKAIENAVQAAHDKAMAITELDPLDLRKEQMANDSKPTEKSRDPEGVRHYEEDTQLPLGEGKAPAFPAGGETLKTAKAEPEKTVHHTNSTADKLIEAARKQTENKGQPDGKKFSTMNVGDGPATPEQNKAVRDFVTKVLGEKTGLEFVEKMKHVGEATVNGITGEEMIKISTMAADKMSIGHHEALHIFFKRLIKADQKAANVLLRAANAPVIVARLKQLLKDHPEALKQLSDPEERLAYMYQFAADGHKGLINIGPETKTWFNKVKSVFRKIAAVWADDFATAEAIEKASDILAAFHEGKFADKSTVAQVIHDKFPRGPYEAAEAMMPWLAKTTNKFLWTATGAVRDANIPSMTKIMDRFFTSASEGQEAKPGFIQEKHTVYNRFVNKVADAFQTMPTAERQKIVWDDLHTGKPVQTPEGKMIRKVLDDAHDYLVAKGVQLVTKGEGGKIKYEKLGKLENYFPRVYDQEHLRTAEGKQTFLDLLAEHKVPPTEAIDTYNAVTRYVESGKPGAEDSAIGLTYFTPALAKRTLGFIPDEKLAPFLNKDLFGTMSQYLQRVARRGEYTERFGNTGEEIKKAREQALTEGATETNMKAFDDSVKAMEGTLGADIDPKLKNIYSGLMTYQNIRLLPLQLFASLIDPLGIMVRGGTAGEAFTAFGKGLRDLATLGKTSKDTEFEIAKTMGAIDAANAHGLMSEMAGSEYMPKIQRAINDKFFRWNGMETWNNRMRSQATVAAQNFIDKHINRPTEHSGRFMDELGLKKGDVLNESNPDYVRAVNKWVDEAILRPNAALRPVYMSDPNWMLISHLKQYTYLFQKVIVSRVYHELQHNNYTPAFALAAYVPGMIAADMMKMMVTPGSGDNNARAGWTLKDWVGHGMQRAGLFGPSQFGLESGTDMQRGGIGIESAAGPTVQQLLQFAQGTAQGRTGLQLEKAVPGYNLIKPAGSNSGGHQSGGAGATHNF